MTKSHKPADVKSRRAFLKGGAAVAAAGAATLAMPNVAPAQEAQVWKFQSTWPQKDIFHEFAGDFVARVNEMAGGRLKLELLAAGAVAKALEVQDAVIAGTLDGGHGVTAYWYGKHKAYSLFGTPPAWGWRANQMIGWMKYGGGQALYDELVQQVLGLDLVGFLTGPMPTQPLGWFKQEITDVAQLQGLKYRTVGLSADLFKEMGAAVTIMGGGEIVPAMDRGLARRGGIQQPVVRQAPRLPRRVARTTCCRAITSRPNASRSSSTRPSSTLLPRSFRRSSNMPSKSSSTDMSWKAMDRYSNDLAALKAAGVKVHRTPDSVLQAQLAAWDKVIAAQSADPFFAKVVESQKAWAKRVVGMQFEMEVDQKPAYDHFFPA